jgi:O-acetylhomoserine/O-acetylserine sulfhydrylase-like pyridoxal-dependent enzyme
VLLQVGTVEYDELPKSKEHRSERYGSPPFKTAWACLIFEVKPTIHSVGAVIRQCKAIRHIVGLTDLKCASVIPVVNSSDPKFSLLREMMPEVIGWADGGPT